VTREELVKDAVLVLGLVFIFYGLALVALSTAFTVVGALLLGSVAVPGLIDHWRGGDDRE
jgi:hypothetical protein